MLLYPLVLENRFFENFTLNLLSSTIFLALSTSSMFSPTIGFDGATTPIVSPFSSLEGIFLLPSYFPF